MKIVSTGRTISTDEYYRRKVKERRRKRIIISGGVLLVMVALVLLLRIDAFRIRDISVSGAAVIGADTVETKVREALAGNYLFIVPRDSALMYPKRTIIKELQAMYPRFSSIELSLEGVETLQIDVVEREPFALYCEGEVSPCYFLDDQGFIFDRAPIFSEGVYFLYTSEAEFTNPLGRALLPREEFRAVSEMVRKLKTWRIQPRRLALAEGEYQLFLESGARIRWLRGNDTSMVLSNLESFLSSDAIKDQNNFWEQLSELDLRTDNKVFYSFK